MVSGRPTGTVTFLFTDIEGSTRAWEEKPGAMGAALGRHDALVRQAIEAHAGYVFKTVGDAFCAAFAAPVAALNAAVAAQRALQAEAWDETPLRARMALHTGAAEEGEGDYFGQPLNRVARLLSAGHGGQVLCSLATQELVRDQLPGEIELRDLGECRLRDLIRPERVFQVVGPDLPAEFPALKTLDSRPNNLPAQATPFIGREEEVAAVRRQLARPEVRLLTLTGPGGTGKTRLALQAAADTLDEYGDGVYFVALAPIGDPALVPSAIAEALHVRQVGARSVLEILEDYLREKQALLVLDNFEHVAPAGSAAGELLRAAPRLKVLATSRVLLRVYGEHDFTVPPMALPDPKQLPPLDRLTQYEAVRLFIERAQAVKQDFAVTNANAPAVAEICARLDGLPLAIELAAARIRLLPPEAILGRLSSRLALLTGGARDLPARQRTLRGALEWSYELLDPAERTLFMRLGAFAGGCTLAAAEAVCNGEGDLPLDLLEGLGSLVDKSLVKPEANGGEPRFGMLETIREYALERLAASGSMERLRRAHAEYFLILVEEAEPKLTTAARRAWLDRLGADIDNLRAALQWAVDGGDATLGMRLAGALYWFWYFQGHLSEGRDWLRRALARAEAAGVCEDRLRALSLYFMGDLAWLQGDHAPATAFLEESVALLRALGEKGYLGEALLSLGLTTRDRGDPAASRAPLEASVAIFRELGEHWKLAQALVSLGRAEALLGHAEAAPPLLDESEALFGAAGDRWGQALARANLGLAAFRQEDYDRAQALYAQALTMFGQFEEKVFVARTLGEVAWVACRRGETERAARLLGAAEALRETLGASVQQVVRAEHEGYVAGARAHLGEAAFGALWAEGRAMTLEQAIAYVLE